jgi:hypothetical protein
MMAISKRLSDAFGWTVQEAALVILSDECPVIPAVRTHSRAVLAPGSKIVLEIEPYATPEEVSSAFRQARTRMMGHRYRPLSEKRLLLALVTYPMAKQHAAGTRRKVIGKGPGVTWGQLRVFWNARFADWAYTLTSNFTRDALETYGKLFAPEYQELEDSDTENLLVLDGLGAVLGDLGHQMGDQTNGR